MQRSIVVSFLTLCFVVCGGALLAGPATQPADTSAVVLDTTGFWRLHHTLRPPVVRLGDGDKPALVKFRWLNAPSPEPPADWAKVGFDDGAWSRGPARLECRTPYLARQCLRGKFRVTDPANVRALKLSLGFHGGAIVYVNGAEIARAHLPRGAALAEPYPVEAFVDAKGELIGRRSRGAEILGRRELRERSLTVAISGRMLRKGVNVVAIEIVRAPYNKVCTLAKAPDRYRPPHDFPWNTCQINRVQLVAAGPDGLQPNATRPRGLQVWNSDLLAGDFDLDFGDRCEPVRPIRLTGARNGCFSGKVVLGSDKPIVGLRATMSEWKGAAGTIHASAARVRYGIEWGHEYVTRPYTSPPPYPAETRLFGAIAPAPPDPVPVAVRERKASPRALRTPGQPKPVFGAVVPIWVTVKVPGGAAAGTYSGTLTLRAEGEKPVDVPVELRVADWTLPDTQDYRTWVELIEVPDTLALEYSLEPWSDRHFEMIAKSFQFCGEVGSRVVYVPLICETNIGHAESMVRWVRKSDGGYEQDFSILDRYLDLAVKHMGRPKIVAFNVWEIYLLQTEKFRPSATMRPEVIEARKVFRGKGPLVTVLDRKTGKTENVRLPVYTDPAARALWQPLMSAVRDRMKARGLEGVMALAYLSDVMPGKGEVALFAEIAPDVPWVSHSHHGIHGKGPNNIYGLARTAYQARVWHTGFAEGDPVGKRRYGWRRKDLVVQFQRGRDMNSLSCTKWRHQGELNITGDQRGIGRLGADFWYVMKDKKGRRRGPVSARYPQSSWRNLDLWTSLLAPGPDGPVATTRFEVFREGIQECEARIFIETALIDPVRREAIGDELATRCEQTLDERAMHMWRGFNGLQLTGAPYQYATGTSWRGSGLAGHHWFVGSGWQRRSETLYGLAAEVGGKLKSR